MSTAEEQFESVISRLVEPLNGQYPRPWMTDSTDPLSASLFIVGKNQATEYKSNLLTHQRHVDSLFNRPVGSCRRVYEEVTGSSFSRTRENTNRLRSVLELEGFKDILETNVICYATPMSRDLRLPQHTGGEERGKAIFQVLLDWVRPKVLIAHGSGTGKILGQFLGAALPSPPVRPVQPVPTRIAGMTVFVIPSLAPPQWNQWAAWAESYMVTVARAAAQHCGDHGPPGTTRT